MGVAGAGHGLNTRRTAGWPASLRCESHTSRKNVAILAQVRRCRADGSGAGSVHTHRAGLGSLGPLSHHRHHGCGSWGQRPPAQVSAGSAVWGRGGRFGRGAAPDGDGRAGIPSDPRSVHQRSTARWRPSPGYPRGPVGPARSGRRGGGVRAGRAGLGAIRGTSYAAFVAPGSRTCRSSRCAARRRRRIAPARSAWRGVPAMGALLRSTGLSTVVYDEPPRRAPVTVRSERRLGRGRPHLCTAMWTGVPECGRQGQVPISTHV